MAGVYMDGTPLCGTPSTGLQRMMRSLHDHRTAGSGGAISRSSSRRPRPGHSSVMPTVLDDKPVGSYAVDSPMARTNVDWNETATEHVFKADIPGLSKNDVQVQVEDGEDGRTLTISGHFKRENVRETVWHQVERIDRQFMHKFQLPENAILDAVTAEMDSGVLTVVVPKLEKKAHGPRTIEIGKHEEPAATTQAGPSKQPPEQPWILDREY